MDIAAMSIALIQGQVQQQAGISVMKMAMGVAAENSQAVAEMAQSVQPHLGANIDIQA